MATQSFDTHLFENGRFAPHKAPVSDPMQWTSFLAAQGYAPEEQVWGQYPDAYIKVYEAPESAPTPFRFGAVLNLVAFPHHVFIRDLNGLIQLLNLLEPLFSVHSRSDRDRGDALFGTQGADTQAEAAKP